MKWFTRREGDSRPWPAYLFGGRLRTSTWGLMVAFLLTWWLYAANQPEIASTPESQTQQVVPPGFVPDPDYTWVPRTNVQEVPLTTEPLTTTTTTTTPTTTSATDTTATTSPTDTDTTDPSATSSTSPGPTTTAVDPDGLGPLPPTTVTVTTSGSSVPPGPGGGPTPSTTPTTPQS